MEYMQARSIGEVQVITALCSVEEARALPAGSLVGDARGGVTFSDAVANVLEQRSYCGWRDIPEANATNWEANATNWTVIYLNR